MSILLFSSSRLNNKVKPKLTKTKKFHSNPLRTSHRIAQRFEFFNTINGLINVEEVGNPSESSVQEVTFEEEDSSKDVLRKTKNSMNWNHKYM